MKLRPDQLDQQLGKELKPVYLISGDEVLLCQEAADSVRKAVSQQGIDERLRYVADNQFDWQDVITENQSLSLFSSRRLFDIQIDKLGEKHTKALAQLGSELSGDNILLISMPKLDSRTQKSKWFTQLESQGVFVQIWPVDANRLPQWVQQRASALNLTLTRDAAALLCERGEGNLLALSQELEKIAMTRDPGSHIDVQSITESVSDSSRYTIYDLSDRLLLGKCKEALHCLQQLFAEGVENNIVLWLINREVSLLDTLLKDSASQPLRQACQKNKIWDKRIPFYEAAIGRHTPTTIHYMLRYLALMDKRIKGLDGPDLDTGFRNLVMMFCGYKPTPTELDLYAV